MRSAGIYHVARLVVSTDRWSLTEYILEEGTVLVRNNVYRSNLHS